MIAWYRLGMMLVTLVGSSACAWAHPFHISDAEIEFDSKADRLQVSLKLQALDLEQALAKIVGSKVNIERLEAKQHIADYIAKRFYVTNALEPSGDVAPVAKSSEQRSKLQLVGQELKGAWLWIYFELELPKPRNDLRLVNTILFETTDSQINSILVRHAAERTSLKTTLKQPTVKFRSEWLKTE